MTDEAMAELLTELKVVLPGLGENVAIDSTDIPAYANPDQTPISDPDATWGHRTPKAKSKNKRKGQQTEPFFGYKMHSLGDVKYGAPLAHIGLPANNGDMRQLPPAVDKAQKLIPWLKPKHVIADKGYDSQANHVALIKRGITPIIHIRKPSSHAGLYDDLYTNLGAPSCDGKTGMEFVRTDPKTGHHLFRCPPKGGAGSSAKGHSLRLARLLTTGRTRPTTSGCWEWSPGSIPNGVSSTNSAR